MAHKVIMPKQGLQMTEGTITKWLAKEGGRAVKDEPLFEMETDKLTITIDAPRTGVLLKIVRGEGETVPITRTIAVIGEEGEDISGLLEEEEVSAEAGPPEEDKPVRASAKEVTGSGAAQESAGGRVLISPRAKKLAQDKGADIACIRGSGPEGLIAEKDVLEYLAARPAATPLARKVAGSMGIDVANVAGTGARGKITKSDVLAAGSNAAGRERQEKGSGRGERIIPMSGMRKVIAERMSESLRVHAQLTHCVRVDMTNAAKLREMYKEEEKKVSYNDIVLMAASRALRDFPMMNAVITEDGILMRDYVNLGVAVAVENGLIVPNIKDADLMRLEEIGMMAKELALRAKENRLTQEDYAGGTFTVSNLGMFGLDAFTAIINTPESGILALGAIQKTPVAVEEEVEIRPIMSMTLTYDHRIIDGAPAAEFLGRVKRYVEAPYLML